MSAGRRNVKDMSKVFALLGIIALLSALLTVLCACKDNVPEKYVKKWYPHSDYSDSDYRVVRTGGEIRILQLTDVNYDNSNDRKEDAIALLKYVIETRMPILSP